ncbi:recombinase family protein [Lachnospiraceae bacterium ZAX-1]
MGRLSKRKKGQSADIQPAGIRVCKAGIYARLSVDSSNTLGKESKNESIDVQIEIAKQFIESYNNGNKGTKIEIFDAYSDLGKTGTNFNRDEFARLMQDIRLGDVDCVIVKDLSRFGRNYLEAGNYIEKIFPFLGVRFISVSDHLDSGADGGGTKQMAAEIKNLMHDMYAKDSSKKAKVQLKQRRESGSYVGGPPPYGYRAIMEGRIRKLVPDEDAVDVVRSIYKAFLEKKAYQPVADELNQGRVNPPSIYKKTGEVCCPEGVGYKGWDKGSVKRILESRTYAGGLVQGKTSITERNEENRVRLPQGEWVVKEHAHEPTVSEEVFTKAAETIKGIEIKMKSQKRPPTDRHVPLAENVFDDVLYCGLCGRKMTRINREKTYVSGEMARIERYTCLNAHGTKKEKKCESNNISKQELLGIFHAALKAEFFTCLKRPKAWLAYHDKLAAETCKSYETKIKAVMAAHAKLEAEESALYIAYREDAIVQNRVHDNHENKNKNENKNQNENKSVNNKVDNEKQWQGQHNGWQASLQRFKESKRENEKQRKKIEKQKADAEAGLKTIEREAAKMQKAIRALCRLKDENAFTRELVNDFAERVMAYPGKRVEIKFAFSKEFIPVPKSGVHSMDKFDTHMPYRRSEVY